MRRFISITLFILCFSYLSAQNLEIESFAEDLSTLPGFFNRLDFNGDSCSVVKVELDEEDVHFTGNMIGLAKRTEGGYLVYMAQGSKRLKISPLEFLPIEVSFPDYGVTRLKKGKVYTLKFKQPNVTSGNVTIGITTFPPAATITMDGKDVGESPIILPGISTGIHKFTIKAKGYETYNKTQLISGDKGKELFITMKKMLPVSVQCNVGKSEILIDDAVTVPGKPTMLAEGEHQVTIKAEGFQNSSQIIKVSKKTDNIFEMNLTREIVPNGVKYTLIYIPADSVKSKGEKIAVKPYYIGTTEITQEFWESIMDNNPSLEKGKRKPVTHVSWQDCQVFIDKLNKLTGLKFSLPSVVEWQYAANGGPWKKKNSKSSTQSLDEVAWYVENSGKVLHNVAQKKANKCGLYDMLGNVSEWCNDLSEATSDETIMYTHCGGSKNDPSYYCTPFSTSENTADFYGGLLGLRLVLH